VSDLTVNSNLRHLPVDERIRLVEDSWDSIASDQAAIPRSAEWYNIDSIFEFDRSKSGANLTKHGIDFIEAQILLNDSNLLEIPAKTTDEPRFLVIGMIKRKHGSALVTYRDENIRLISVRLSRDEELALYES